MEMTPEDRADRLEGALDGDEYVQALVLVEGWSKADAQAAIDEVRRRNDVALPDAANRETTGGTFPPAIDVDWFHVRDGELRLLAAFNSHR